MVRQLVTYQTETCLCRSAHAHTSQDAQSSKRDAPANVDIAPKVSACKVFFCIVLDTFNVPSDWLSNAQILLVWGCI